MPKANAESQSFCNGRSDADTISLKVDFQLLNSGLIMIVVKT